MLLTITGTNPRYPNLYEAVEPVILDTPLAVNNKRIVESFRPLQFGSTYSFVLVHKFVNDCLVLGQLDKRFSYPLD